MKKRNLIIGGLILLFALVGGISFGFFKIAKERALKEKPEVSKPEKQLITLTEEEEKNINQFLGLSFNEVPEIYKDKVNLYKEKLKNDCLSKKEKVKNFLWANDDENILKEMKEITISSDLLTPKITPAGEKIDFKIDKQIIFECLNLNKDEFRNCQSKLNGLEINNQNIENSVGKKVNIGKLIQEYLEWEAIKQNDENICQKLNLYNGFMGNYDENTVNNCIRYTQIIRFVVNLYKKPALTCKNLCQKTDKIFGVGECLTACSAIKDNKVDKCNSLKDVISKTMCKAIISFNPDICNDLVSKSINIYEEGQLTKEDMVPICKRNMYMYNAVKQDKVSLLAEAYKIKFFEGGGEVEYLDRLYFKKETTDTNFDEGYANYCNLKYSL